MIETLDNNSQILLLYLADELPEADRLEVERRLADPAVREELEQLHLTYGLIDAHLRAADDLADAVNVGAVAKAIGRQMRQRLAEPHPVENVAKQRATSHVRPWLIPSAVAAAILVGSAVWILRSGALASHQPLAVRTGPTTATSHPTGGPTALAPAGDGNLKLFQDSFTPPNRDIADVLNSNASQKDLSMQDDVSPFLLRVGTVQE